MKARTLILAASLAAAMSAGAQTSKGINPAYMNTAVKPGNDFYEYAIGGWRKAHPLDAEHARNGSFIDLDELNQNASSTLSRSIRQSLRPRARSDRKSVRSTISLWTACVATVRQPSLCSRY